MKKTLKFFLLFVLAMSFVFTCAVSVNAASVDLQNDFAFKTFESKANAGYSLNYRIYVPKNYDSSKSYPVLMFLHGAGERGSDNTAHVNGTVKNLFDTRYELFSQTIVICPQCPSGEQWVDYPWSKGNYSVDKVPESKALSTAFEILQSVMAEYSCDSDRVYAMGLSMGGYGTWDLLVRHGDTFAAAVPICGGGDPSKAEQLKNIPIWTYHGTADPTVSFNNTKEMYESITAAGGSKITFNAVEGAGHNVWTDATTNGALLDWLMASKLSDRLPKEEVTEVPEEVITTGPETDKAPEGDDNGGCKGSVVAMSVPAAIVLAGAFVFKKKKQD